MDRATRNELIDAYFECLDTLEYDRLQSVYTDDVELGWTDGRVVRGWDDVREFYATERGDNDTAHRTRKRLHDGDRVAVEGEVTYTHPVEDTHGFCDVFEFRDGRISRVSIYPKH